MGWSVCGGVGCAAGVVVRRYLGLGVLVVPKWQHKRTKSQHPSQGNVSLGHVAQQS